MRISHQTWLNYINKLDAIDSKAADLMTEWVETNGLDDRDALIEYAYAVCTKYGEAAAALACEMYDATAIASGVTVPAAMPAETATLDEVGRAVNGSLRRSQVQVPSTVSRLTRQAAADTTLQNAQRDGAQFAWVPHGDTCAFCITLASNGWRYMSKKALKHGHAEHIHSNCDCNYAVRFSEKDSIAGYDPKVYQDMYYGAEGNTPQERINSMRRAQYQNDKDRINAMKRAAYARRHGTFGLAAGQTNNRIQEHDPPVFIRELVDGEDRREVLLGYESQIADEPVENAIVITKDGRIYHCFGDLNGVYPDNDLGDELYGADMTHNHPVGSNNEYTFSSMDVRLFEKYKLNSLRGIDERYIYELNHNPATLDSPTPSELLDEYSVQHDIMIDKAERRGYGYFRRRR